jgi:hypothetical protein
MVSGPPGTYEICKICFWEDDAVQLRYLNRNGANPLSLVQAQKNYAAFGACEENMLKHVRPPLPGEERDPEWRPVDLRLDYLEPLGSPKSYMQVLAEDVRDPKELYYWRK